MKQPHRAILGLFFILILGVSAPVMVHADIFLKPNASKQKAGQESDGSWFSRFMSFGKASNKAKSNQDAARKLTIEPYIYKPANVVANAHRVVPKGEPRSPAELMAKAEALKAVNLQAMRELREMDRQIASVKMQNYLKQVEDNKKRATKEQYKAAALAYKQNKKQGQKISAGHNSAKRIYVSPRSTGLKTPPKVFTDYR